MVDLKQLANAAFRLQGRLKSEGLPFCYIGGLAVQRWGEPRFTDDVDATVFVDFGGERKSIARLLQWLRPRIDDAVEFAMHHRVLLVEDEQGVPVDISLAALPFESEVIGRSTLEILHPKVKPLRLCGATDLVILKAFAGRPRDWEDVRGVLIRSEKLIEWDLIGRELKMLLDLKEEPEHLDRLYELKGKLGL